MSQSYLINAPLTFEMGSNADGDLYYRLGSTVARLPIGSEAEVLGVTSGALAWGTGTRFRSDAAPVVTILTSDRNVGITGNTSSTVTVNLPAISSSIQEVTIIDENGGAAANNILINPSGGNTINQDTDTLINLDHMSLTFLSDGVGNWLIQ